MNTAIVVLITGEVGSGKTTLAEWLSARQGQLLTKTRMPFDLYRVRVAKVIANYSFLSLRFSNSEPLLSYPTSDNVIKNQIEAVRRKSSGPSIILIDDGVNNELIKNLKFMEKNVINFHITKVEEPIDIEFFHTFTLINDSTPTVLGFKALAILASIFDFTLKTEFEPTAN